MKKCLILTVISFTMVLSISYKAISQICNITPQVSTSSFTVTCSTTAADINAAITNKPAGAQIMWFNNNAHNGSSLSIPSSQGVFYPFFYDQVNDCYSATTPVNFINNCTCDDRSSNIIQINQDIRNGNFVAKKMHITNSITIYGNTNLHKVKIIVDPGVTITIAADAVLTGEFVHITCCNGMWQGINVLNGGRVVLNQDPDWLNVIEDAIVGIHYDFPSPYTINAPQDLLHIQGTVFNRCETGVKISNLYVNLAGGNKMPFYISGCIFTSRELPIQNGWGSGIYTVSYGMGWTVNWSNSYSGIPNTLNAPFINYPPTPCPDNTANAFLHRGNYNEKPSYGIKIENCCESGQYIYIGNNLGSYNYVIFDNIDIGVDASNAQLWVNNCIFQKTPLGATNGIGIRIGAMPDRVNHTNLMVLNTDIDNNPAIRPNAFFDLNTAIHANSIQGININGCIVRSGQSKLINSPTGKMGFNIEDIQSSRINITNNQITNIAAAITYSNQGGYNGNENVVHIDNNEIFAQLPGTTPTNNEFIGTGISLTGWGNNITGDLQPLTCLNNKIIGAYQGIIVTDFLGKSLDIRLNEITLTQAPLLRGTLQEQYGIRLNNGTPAVNNGTVIRSIVQNNLINGSFSNGNIPTNSKQTGIYLATQHLTDVDCNKAENLTHGFRFLNLNNVTKFFDNTIEPTNLNGFTLDQAAQIGRQGFSSRGVKCNSDNSWKMPANTWLTNYNTPHRMTFVRNAIARNSPLFVRNTTTLNPSGASGASSQTTLAYSQTTNANQSIFPQNPTTNACTHCIHSTNTPNTEQEALYEEEVATLEDIADGSIDLIDDDPTIRLFVMQQQLYEQLQAQGSNYTNSTTLQDFLNNPSITSFDYIYYIQQYLADGNTAAVDYLLGYMPNNNVVEQNYFTYYSWMANMIDSPNYTPNIDDVYAMASLCPAKNGSVVYKARKLYNQLTGSHELFNDECPESSATSRKKKPVYTAIEPIVNNSYIAYPNPVVNTFNINNKDMVRFVITDIAGKVLLQQQCVGVEKETIDIGLFKTGIYLLQLYKADNTCITQKLIKQ